MRTTIAAEVERLATDGPTAREVEVAQVIDKRVGAAIAAACFVDHTPPPPETDRHRVAERERGAGRPTTRDRRDLDRWRDR